MPKIDAADRCHRSHLSRMLYGPVTSDFTEDARGGHHLPHSSTDGLPLSQARPAEIGLRISWSAKMRTHVHLLSLVLLRFPMSSNTLHLWSDPSFLSQVCCQMSACHRLMLPLNVQFLGTTVVVVIFFLFVLLAELIFAFLTWWLNYTCRAYLRFFSTTSLAYESNDMAGDCIGCRDVFKPRGNSKFSRLSICEGVSISKLKHERCELNQTKIENTEEERQRVCISKDYAYGSSWQ
eukprot:6205080-Pleurochrysis_carterae.AAC.1